MVGSRLRGQIEVTAARECSSYKVYHQQQRLSVHYSQPAVLPKLIWVTEPLDKWVLFAYTMGFMENHKMVMYFTPAGKQRAMLPEETMLMLYVCSKVLLSKPHCTIYKMMQDTPVRRRGRLL